MEILIRDNPEAGAKVGTNVVRKIIQDVDKPVLAMATGRTPLRMYKESIRMNQSGELSFRNCTTFNLDEYGGLSPENKYSYHYYVMSNFFKHTYIDKMNVHLPDGCKEDLRESCRKYENLLNDAGGVDLKVLGIGANRHIGFNELTGPFASSTLVKILSKQTIQDNLIYFEKLEEVPRYVVTIGIATIMESRNCLLITNGAKKADAIRNMIEDTVSASCPASILQMHPHVTIVLDEKASYLLIFKDHYKLVKNTNQTGSYTKLLQLKGINANH